MKDSYTRESINTMRLKIAKIEKGVKKAFYMPAWEKLTKKAKLERSKSFLVESQLAYKYYMQIKDGEYLEKFHYSSSGSKKEYFKIIDSKTLRWCHKQSDISNIKACHSYDLSQIRGLTYGKVTSTFTKKKNDKCLPWLCMSIMMDNRPFDVQCTELNINNWYIGLAYAIKKHNPDAYVLSVGKFLWRKFKYVLVYLVKSKMPSEMKKSVKQDMSFIKALNYYRRLKLYKNKE